MAVLDRVFLGLVALILVLAASLLTLSITGNDFFVNWLESSNLLFDGGILAVILLLLAAYLVVLITRQEKRKFIVYEKELGAVKISADSIQGLIAEAAREMPGLHQVAARITDVDEPKVKLKVQVYPDYNIPQFSEDLQQHVKDYVERTVGVVIDQVEIHVVGITGKDAVSSGHSL